MFHTDGWADITKLLVAFRNFVNASENSRELQHVTINRLVGQIHFSIQKVFSLLPEVHQWYLRYTTNVFSLYRWFRNRFELHITLPHTIANGTTVMFRMSENISTLYKMRQLTQDMCYVLSNVYIFNVVLLRRFVI